MKNILNIELNWGCNCSCFENIDDNTNRVIIRFIRDYFSGSTIECNGVQHSLQNVDDAMVFVMDESYFQSAGTITFRYLGSGYEGQTFTIECPKDCPADDDSLIYKTLKITRTGTYSFVAEWITIVDFSEVSLGEGLKIEDGKLTLENNATLKSINVTENSEKLITSVTLNYKQDSKSEESEESEEELIEKTYSISYDDNRNITKFGDIDVSWTVGT